MKKTDCLFFVYRGFELQAWRTDDGVTGYAIRRRDRWVLYDGDLIADTVPGTMTYLNKSATLRLDLRDGEIHEIPGLTTEGKYRRGTFDLHTLFLQNRGAILQRSEKTTRGDREMNIQMMLAEIAKREELKVARYEKASDKMQAAGAPEATCEWLRARTRAARSSSCSTIADT